MTENKRFDAKEYGHIIVYRENGKNMWHNKVHIRMNEIWDEKEELKKENEQLKQFKEKVLSLFDKEIIQNEKAIEWGKEIGADSGAIGFYNHMLKRLKKELQE